MHNVQLYNIQCTYSTYWQSVSVIIIVFLKPKVQINDINNQYKLEIFFLLPNWGEVVTESSLLFAIIFPMHQTMDGGAIDNLAKALDWKTSLETLKLLITHSNFTWNLTHWNFYERRTNGQNTIGSARQSIIVLQIFQIILMLESDIANIPNISNNIDVGELYCKYSKYLK